MNNETRGRKKKADQDEVAKSTTVSLTKTEKAFLIGKYKSLTAAIKTLLVEGKPTVETNYNEVKTASTRKAVPTPKLNREPTMAELWREANRQQKQG